MTRTYLNTRLPPSAKFSPTDGEEKCCLSVVEVYKRDYAGFWDGNRIAYCRKLDRKSEHDLTEADSSINLEKTCFSSEQNLARTWRELYASFMQD